MDDLKGINFSNRGRLCSKLDPVISICKILKQIKREVGVGNLLNKTDTD